MPYDGTSVLEYLQKTHQTPLLSEREKHLVGLAVTLTRGCQVCTRNRIEKARAAGLEDDVLNALVGIVSAVNAGVAAATAREAFRLADASLAEACGDLCAVGGTAGR
jgi:alkylhydroperoxidase/carboxymuconolactone decarboxylase family protein YurZ